MSRHCLHTTVPLLPKIKPVTYDNTSISSEVPGRSSKFQKARTDGIFMGKEKNLFVEKRTSGGLK